MSGLSERAMRCRPWSGFWNPVAGLLTIHQFTAQQLLRSGHRWNEWAGTFLNRVSPDAADIFEAWDSDNSGVDQDASGLFKSFVGKMGAVVLTMPTAEPMNGASRDLPALLTNAPLCGARTRAGSCCRLPKLRGRDRCKLHGGRSTGVSGERNGAFKHGHHTNEAVALRQAAQRLLSEVRDAAPA